MSQPDIRFVYDTYDGDYLECPCCGDDGAVSDDNGEFYDGQVLICGCPGWVSVNGDEDPWINNGDAPCQKCEP